MRTEAQKRQQTRWTLKGTMGCILARLYWCADTVENKESKKYLLCAHALVRKAFDLEFPASGK